MEYVVVVSSQILKFKSQRARVLELLLQEALSAGYAFDGARFFISQEHKASSIQLAEGHMENVSILWLVYFMRFLNLFHFILMP